MCALRRAVLCDTGQQCAGIVFPITCAFVCLSDLQEHFDYFGNKFAFFVVPYRAFDTDSMIPRCYCPSFCFSFNWIR